MVVCMFFCIVAAWISRNNEKSRYLDELMRDVNHTETVLLQIDGKEYPVEIVTSKIKKTQTEAIHLLEEVEKQIKKEECYLGHNKKKDQITGKLNLQEEYLQRQVQCTWSTSPSGYIAEDGFVQQFRLWNENKVSQRVILTARLTCEGIEKVISEQITVQKAQMSSSEEVVSFVNEWIKNQQLKEPTAKKIKLPNELQEKQVHWKTITDKKSWIFLILGVAACVTMFLGERQTKIKEEMKRKERYQALFPPLVQELSVLLSAGMSVRGCFSKIGEAMCKQKKQQFLGIQLVEMVQSIQKGENEIQVYQRFANKIDVGEYRRLINLIIQNICKGTFQMSERLAQMAQDSYVEQLRQVKIRGEKVSTKLLIPMGILLIMILLMVIMPALAMKI